MENTLIIELGADSIKLAEFSYPSESQIVIEHFSIYEYGGDFNEEQMLDALCVQLKTALLTNAFSAKRAFVCVSGQLVFMKFLKLPPISDTDRLKEVAEFEARQNMPFPIDEVEWHAEVLPSADGGEPEAMFVVIKRTTIERISHVIEGCGFKIALVDVAPTAGYNAARLNGFGQEQCTMLLNIGGRTSTLTFIEGDRFFVRTIPIAGHYITEQIQKEFNISYKEAEDMKRSIGFVALGGAYEEPTSEAAATVSKIARNAMTRLHGEINRSINVYRASQGGNRPEVMYLSGGGAIMQHATLFFNEKMRIHVDYLNPFSIVTIGEFVNKELLEESGHLLSEVIGTCARAVTHCPMNVNLLPTALIKQNEVKQRIPYLYGAIAVLLLGSGVFYVGSSMEASYYENHKNKYATTLDEKEALVDSISSEMSIKKKLETELNALLDNQKNRTAWLDIMNEIQSLLPTNSWVVEVKATESKKEIRKSNSKGKTEVPVDQVEWVEVAIYTLCQKDQTGSDVQEKIEKKIKQNDKTSLFLEVQKGKNTLPTDKVNLASSQIKFKLKAPIVQKQQQ